MDPLSSSSYLGSRYSLLIVCTPVFGQECMYPQFEGQRISGYRIILSPWSSFGSSFRFESLYRQSDDDHQASRGYDDHHPLSLPGNHHHHYYWWLVEQSISKTIPQPRKFSKEWKIRVLGRVFALVGMATAIANSGLDCSRSISIPTKAKLTLQSKIRMREKSTKSCRSRVVRVLELNFLPQPDEKHCFHCFLVMIIIRARRHFSNRENGNGKRNPVVESSRCLLKVMCTWPGLPAGQSQSWPEQVNTKTLANQFPLY